MKDKTSVAIILIIMLLVAIAGIFLSPKNKNISSRIEQTYKQTETNKVNYDALSSMVNVQNARLVKVSIVLQQKIIDLTTKVQQLETTLDSEIYEAEVIEKENSKLLKEIARLQELVINQEEKIHNLEEKDKDFQNRFEQSGQFFKDIADLLAGINRDIMSLIEKDRILQDKINEICAYLKKLYDKPIDIRRYKFHKPGCN